MSNTLPIFPKHEADWRGRAEKIGKVGAAGEGEHRRSAVSGDRAQLLHYVAHSCFACRDEEDGEIVDAEMLVDRA